MPSVEPVSWAFRWNQLDLAIVLLSIMGINTLEEIEVNASLPINPTIIRIMRVLRIARGQCRLLAPPWPLFQGDLLQGRQQRGSSDWLGRRWVWVP